MDALLTSAGPLTAGYVLDLLLGDPAWLPHPVVGIGRTIAWGERLLNRGTDRARFIKGLLLAAGLVAGTYGIAAGLQALAFKAHPVLGVTCATVGVFFGLANRKLIAEGRAVFRALDHSLTSGRTRLTRIVGRDTAHLSATEVRVAVFETMAENLSDGSVAPLCFYALGGMPAMLAYKAVNTLDSMIGHHGARFEWFGKTAARIDDAANFIPARLTACLMVMLAGSIRGAQFVWRYASSHPSPNAGYPEAALAGILDLRFGGPHTYDGELIPQPWIGQNPRPIEPSEIGTVVWINHAVSFVVVLLAGFISCWR